MNVGPTCVSQCRAVSDTEASGSVVVTGDCGALDGHILSLDTDSGFDGKESLCLEL